MSNSTNLPYFNTVRVTNLQNAAGGTTSVAINSTRQETGTESTVESGNSTVTRNDQVTGSENAVSTTVDARQSPMVGQDTMAENHNNNTNTTGTASEVLARNLLSNNSSTEVTQLSADIAISIKFSIKFQPNQVPWPPPNTVLQNPYTT